MQAESLFVRALPGEFRRWQARYSASTVDQCALSIVPVECCIHIVWDARFCIIDPRIGWPYRGQQSVGPVRLIVESLCYSRLCLPEDLHLAPKGPYPTAVVQSTQGSSGDDESVLLLSPLDECLFVLCRILSLMSVELET